MANWYGHKMTRVGQDLLAVLNSRELPLKITSVRMGSGTLGSQVVVDLKALIKQELSIEVAETPKRAGDGRWNITAVYNNSMIQTGFYFREWGVFAQDPDTLDEVLVFYANSGDSADYIPAFDGSGSSTSSYIEEQLICACTAGSADVTAVLSSAQYALAEDLQDHAKDADIHVTKEQKEAWNTHAAKHATTGSDPITPSSIGAAAASHAGSHKTGGADALKPEDIGAAAASHAASHKTGGTDALTPSDIGAAAKSTIITATLAAASWSGDSAPYTYTLVVSGVTASSNQEILPSLDITQEQLEALQGANIVDGGQAAGSITLKAWGDKPSVDIPIRIIRRGD